MAYTLKYTKWFSNRPTYTTNKFGISPSSKFIYKEMEIEAYKTSSALMSQALLYVSNQVTENSAQLVVKKNSDDSYTDGKHIVVGMNPMNEYNAYDGMDIEMGLACHEACHCAFTDFKNYDLEKVKYPIAHWLHNVYEDECIEEMLGVRKPQWMYFLNHVLSHYFSEDKFINSIKKLVLSNSKIDIVQFMILYMVRNSELSNRFPKEWIDEFGPMLDEIYEKVIVKLETPDQFKYTPTKNTVVASIDTIEIIKKYVSLDDINSDLAKPNLGMIGNSSTEGNPNLNKNCGQNGLFSPNTKTGRSKSNHVIKQKFDNAKNALNDNSSNNLSDAQLVGNAPVDEIGAIKPNNSDTVAYKKIVSSLKEEIRIAKRIIIPNNKKIELEDDKFHRNGQLISSHLVQAIQGVNCVYHRKVVKRSETPDPKYAFVLSIDESGSMGPKSCYEYSPRNIATKLACIFYEAMKDYDGIDLYIYGHGENIVKYVTPKDKNPYKLGNRRCQGMQNDAKSYDTILKDVRLQTNKKIFFLNITDSLYLSNKESLIKTISKWKDRNVSFGLLSINSFEKNKSKYDTINDGMYGDNWVSIPNSKSGMKDSLIKFSNIIKKNYDKLK